MLGGNYTPEPPMDAHHHSRRSFLATSALAAAAYAAPGRFAEDLDRTPSMTAGPFFPDDLPLDTDNDLLVINDAISPAVGRVAHVSGRILDTRGDPIRNATVEIWQCDANGVYIHSGGGPRDELDGNFQGYGRFLTGSTGEYYFRTIRPVPYRPRTPHIHFSVRVKGKPAFTTQLFVEGEPLNERDGLLNSIRDPKARAAIVREFREMPDSPAGELAASFDIVPGFTPEH